MTTPPGTIAFKEWASVVWALEEGKQDLILRKGGIAEEGRGFEVQSDSFLLFPTYFHQQLTGIRREHAGLLASAMQSRPPDGRLRITSWASVTRTFTIVDEAELSALESRHIYTPRVVLDRLHGRYGKSLQALEVKVHRLPIPIDVPLLDAYGGCRSWVTLDILARA